MVVNPTLPIRVRLPCADAFRKRKPRFRPALSESRRVACLTIAVVQTEPEQMLPVVADVGPHAGNGTGNRAAACCGEHRVEGISIAAQIDVEIFPLDRPRRIDAELALNAATYGPVCSLARLPSGWTSCANVASARASHPLKLPEHPDHRRSESSDKGEKQECPVRRGHEEGHAPAKQAAYHS